MITLNDIKVEGSTYRLSLTKLMGKQIKDIHGYLSSELGDPVFKMINVVFEDGTKLGAEGEHDFPYLVGEQPNHNEETLERLYAEES